LAVLHNKDMLDTPLSFKTGEKFLQAKRELSNLSGSGKLPSLERAYEIFDTLTEVLTFALEDGVERQRIGNTAYHLLKVLLSACPETDGGKLKEKIYSAIINAEYNCFQ